MALDGYRRVLTDETIYAQDWMRHPLALEYALVAGRWRMLETGVVLALLRRLGDYPQRLLDASTYLQACAELRAALLLQLMGLRLQREPSNLNSPAQSKRSGPDWLGADANRCCGVEVKCPVESDNLRGRTQLVTHLVFCTHELIGEKGVNIELNPGTIAEAAIGKWPNKPRADNLLLDALVQSELTGTCTTSLGTITPASQGFSSMIGPIPVDEAHETERLRALLEGAAAQLRDWAPGIVILDASADGALMRRCCRVAELMGEPWATDLAMVVLVTGTHPGFVMTIVPGARFESAPRLRSDVCRKGHIHVATFGPRRRCTVNEQFDDFPAYCVRGLGHYTASPRRTDR